MVQVSRSSVQPQPSSRGRSSKGKAVSTLHSSRSSPSNAVRTPSYTPLLVGSSPRKGASFTPLPVSARPPSPGGVHLASWTPTPEASLQGLPTPISTHLGLEALRPRSSSRSRMVDDDRRPYTPVPVHRPVGNAPTPTQRAPEEDTKYSEGLEVEIGDCRVRCIDVLGRGSYSEVWRAKVLGGVDGLDEVALKDVRCGNQSELQQAIFEVQVLLAMERAAAGRPLRVPRCITYKVNHCNTGWKVRTAMTVVPGESLDAFIRHKPSAGLTFEDSVSRGCVLAKKLIMDIAPTLELLAPIAWHRDVNSHNILINLGGGDDGSVQSLAQHATFWLIDFGLAVDSQSWVTERGLWSTEDIGGDSRYWPPSSWIMHLLGPEGFRGHEALCDQYQHRLDVHGLGVTALELLCTLAEAGGGAEAAAGGGGEEEEGGDGPPPAAAGCLSRQEAWAKLLEAWRRYRENVWCWWSAVYDVFAAGEDVRPVQARLVQDRVVQRLIALLEDIRLALRSCAKIEVPEAGVLLRIVANMVDEGCDFKLEDASGMFDGTIEASRVQPVRSEQGRQLQTSGRQPSLPPADAASGRQESLPPSSAAAQPLPGVATTPLQCRARSPAPAGRMTLPCTASSAGAVPHAAPREVKRSELLRYGSPQPRRPGVQTLAQPASPARNHPVVRTASTFVASAPSTEARRPLHRGSGVQNIPTGAIVENRVTRLRSAPQIVRGGVCMALAAESERHLRHAPNAEPVRRAVRSASIDWVQGPRQFANVVQGLSRSKSLERAKASPSVAENAWDSHRVALLPVPQTKCFGVPLATTTPQRRRRSVTRERRCSNEPIGVPQSPNGTVFGSGEVHGVSPGVAYRFPLPLDPRSAFYRSVDHHRERSKSMGMGFSSTNRGFDPVASAGVMNSADVSFSGAAAATTSRASVSPAPAVRLNQMMPGAVWAHQRKLPTMAVSPSRSGFQSVCSSDNIGHNTTSVSSPHLSHGHAFFASSTSLAPSADNAGSRGRGQRQISRGSNASPGAQARPGTPRMLGPVPGSTNALGTLVGSSEANSGIDPLCSSHAVVGHSGDGDVGAGPPYPLREALPGTQFVAAPATSIPADCSTSATMPAEQHNEVKDRIENQDINNDEHERLRERIKNLENSLQCLGRESLERAKVGMEKLAEKYFPKTRQYEAFGSGGGGGGAGDGGFLPMPLPPRNPAGEAKQAEMPGGGQLPQWVSELHQGTSGSVMGGSALPPSTGALTGSIANHPMQTGAVGPVHPVAFSRASVAAAAAVGAPSPTATPPPAVSPPMAAVSPAGSLGGGVTSR